MQKIVVYEFRSLDGVAENRISFFADWDDAMDANLAAVIATQTRSFSAAAATPSGRGSGPAARSSRSRPSSTGSRVCRDIGAA